MSYDFEKAVVLLSNLDQQYERIWAVKYIVEDIAAQTGLGVLTIEAQQDAAACIGRDIGNNWTPEHYQQFDLSIFAPKWANCLLEASQKHPSEDKDYPLPIPKDHGSSCFGQARKGTWSDTCYRAAWGNVKPYGLKHAEKPCPICSKPMRYWCYGKHGDKQFRWSVDHVRSHSNGGCVCWFNLKAIHPHCNSSKGKW